MAENEVNKLCAKDWAVIAIAISALIVSLLLIIFPPFTLTGAGTFDAGGSSWEHQLQIPADSSQRTITIHIVFDQYRTEDCRDIYIEADGQNIQFRNENNIIANDGLCKETDVIFNNDIFGPSAYNIYYGKITTPIETQPAEPATLEMAPSPEPSFTTQATTVTACGDLSTDNEVYTLDRAIYGNQSDGRCLDIQAENVTLDCANYNITGTDTPALNTYAIYVNGYKNLTIKNCNITNYMRGIYAYDSDISNVNYNNITGCTSGCRTGIWLEASINATISYNIIQKNIEAVSGIHLNYSNGTNIHHNTAFSNGAGVFLEHSSQNNITLNNFSSNNGGIILQSYSTYNNITDNNASFMYGGGTKAGISLYDNSGYNSIEGNNVSYNGNGIYIFGSNDDNNTLINNTANNNTQKGIYIENSKNSTLINNTANNNTQQGIYLTSSSNNTLTANTANNNDEGIVLSSSSTNNTLIENKIANIRHGINLDYSDNNTLFNNTFDYNGWQGVYIFFSSNTNITSNSVSNNGKQGILATSGSYNDIISNTINNNTYNGVLTSSSPHYNFTNNTISNNRGTGITISATNSGVLINNTIDNNTEYGIQLSASNNINIANNTANNNTQYGIYLQSSSSNNNLTNNTAVNNTQWDFYSYKNALDNTVIDLEIGSVVVSFTSKGIALRNGTSPGGEPLLSINKYVNATNNSDDSWLFLNVSYADPGDLNNINESTLRIAKNNASGWFTNPADFANAYDVNITDNYVYANITNFESTFAPLGASLPINVSNCMNLTQANQLYVLNQSISGNQSDSICIDVQNSNITLDCLNLYSINGTFSGTTYGIYTNSSNTTIQNCNISNYTKGIQLQNSNYTIVNNNRISNCTQMAITHNFGTDSNFTNNIIYYSAAGIYIGSGPNNIIKNNVIYNNTDEGIQSSGANYTQIINNTITYSTGSNGIGIDISNNYNNTLINNTANYNKWYGIRVETFSNNHTLFNNTANYNNDTGIVIWQGNYSNLINNTANNNLINGFWLFISSHNAFTNNFASNNTQADFNSTSTSVKSENNTVINLTTQQNIVSFNSFGIALKGLMSTQAPSNSGTGYYNISKWINATNNSAGAYLFLNISYNETEVVNLGIDESTLFLARNNGTWETDTSKFASTYGVNTAENYTYANITSFGSMFVPLGPINQPPQIQLNLPSNNTQINNTQTITFNFTAIDDLNATLNCSIYLNGTLNQTNDTTLNYTLTDFTISGISYGYHNWSVNCSDGALSNVSETWFFRIADTMPPVVTIIAPTPVNNSYINVSTATINATVVNGVSNIDTCTLEFNNSNNTMTKNGAGSSVTCDYTKSSLNEGKHNFTVYANETSGNTGSNGTWFFTVDTINTSIYYNPSTTSAGNHSQNWILINITCADTNRDTVILNWNGTNETFDNNAGDVFWENKTALSDGTYTFYAWCNDSATNSNQTATRNVMLDTTPPTITIINPSPANNSVQTSTSAIINATVINGASAIDTCILEFNGTNETMTKIGAGSSVTCNSTKIGLNLGQHNFTVYANDTVGNTGANGTWFFTVHRHEEEIARRGVAAEPAIIYNCSIAEGQSRQFELRVGDSIDCIIRGKLHNIRLAEILDEQQLAEFEIASPLRTALAINQIYYADIDNSGLNDTAIKLLKFALPRNATIILSLLKEVAPVAPTPPAPPAPPTPPPAIAAAPPYALLGLLALLIMVLITTGYRYYAARPARPRAVTKAIMRAPKPVPIVRVARIKEEPLKLPEIQIPPARAPAAPEVTPLQQKIVALRKELAEMKVTELPAKPKARVIGEVKKIPKAKPKMPRPKPAAKPKSISRALKDVERTLKKK